MTYDQISHFEVHVRKRVPQKDARDS